jgi:trehalose/maltose hydrolase-like predicted phosphorylase
VSIAAASKQRIIARTFPELGRRFEAVVFDWDGTAVPDRQADASALRELVHDLCAVGLDLAVITGTHVGNVDGQLAARPPGPGRLYLCVNRGSETFRVDEVGLHLVERREASPAEDAALDEAAAATVAALADRGIRAEIVSQRLNRRKVDLIPDPEWADPPKARISELLAAVEARLRGAGISSLEEAVQLAEQAAREAGLAHPRITSDAKHIEIGLTDKADAARWVFDDLWRRGVGPGLVLCAGDEFGWLGGLSGSDSLLLVPSARRATVLSVGAEPAGAPAGVLHVRGGPERFLEILADQLQRRRDREVPRVDGDHGWTISVDGLDPGLERVHESILTVADGRIGTRGTPLLRHPAASASTLAAGIYEGHGPATELAQCPDWSGLPGDLPLEPLIRRELDFHTGVLRQAVGLPDGTLTSLQFTSLAEPGTVALRANAPEAVLPPTGTRVASGGLATAFCDRRAGEALDRFGAYALNARESRERLTGMVEGGFEAALAAHRAAWGERWDDADIVIEGDAELQRAVRFTLFHLMASVGVSAEAAVGARGLSGSGYRGHVFWDSDVFVLPFLAATHPRAARAMLEYRVARLPAAREAARRLGRRGARFPWESAGDGRDVTPTGVRDPRTGRLVRIRTGELEEHIVADVAWAAQCYLDWTGDPDFAAGPGRDLLTETARYWASRIRLDAAGRGHIYGVIGPDEYHEPVDDNAFTNVMARWNLRRAADLTGVERERSEWRELADALVDGFDPASGLYEQFAGFFRLEPLLIAEVAPRRPIAADLLLGAERVRAAQVLKQADVLMLHHLVPDEVEPGSLPMNLGFYEPRTAHGSSLSPAIHAALFARVDRLPEALAALQLAARIDLDDVTGSTASGLHLATMGGLWHALAYGFAGVRPRGETLVLEPKVPPQWDRLELRLRFRDRRLAIGIEHEDVSVTGAQVVPGDRDGAWEVKLG